MNRDPNVMARNKRTNPVVPVLKAIGERLLMVGQGLLKDPFTLALVVGTVVLLITFFSLLGSIGPEKPDGAKVVPLSQVTQRAALRQVPSARLLDADKAVVARTTTPNEVLYSPYPKSDAATQQLFDQLRDGGAAVSIDQQSAKPEKAILVQFLVPILLLVCLFALFTRIGGDAASAGIASFSAFSGKGQKKGKKGSSQVTFDDIAGAPEALVELREIVDYLNDPTKYASIGALAPKGVLLVGPPGTGKTLLARAVAGEADAQFFSLSGSDFVESLVGVGAARVRDLFRKAREAAPAIIFIDELDAAGRKRGAGVGQGNDEREQTLNQMLVEMDGFGGDAGLVVMAATNRPDILDPALLRPGRFDRQVVVDVPDVHGRFEILSLHAKKKPVAPEVDLMEVAKLCPGFSGAELANLVNEAALLSVRQGDQLIDQKTLEEAIDRVVAGPAKKHVLTLKERQIIAVHESSHAVVTRSIGQTTSALKLSIVARGRQLGTAATQMTDKDAVLRQEPDLQRQLVAVMAGAAGERYQFGVLSTSVNEDLHHATQLARSMVTSFGMSPALGPVAMGEVGGEVFLGAQMQEFNSIGNDTLALIDRETERLVGEAEMRARMVLERNWNAVHETAQALLDHETLSGVALEAVLSTVEQLPLEDLPPVEWRPAGRRQD